MADPNAAVRAVLEELVAEKVGMQRSYPVSGQTYSRKVDSQTVNVLSGFAQSASKFGYDMRLLQHLHEIEDAKTIVGLLTFLHDVGSAASD